MAVYPNITYPSAPDFPIGHEDVPIGPDLYTAVASYIEDMAADAATIYNNDGNITFDVGFGVMWESVQRINIAGGEIHFTALQINNELVCDTPTITTLNITDDLIVDNDLVIDGDIAVTGWVSAHINGSSQYFYRNDADFPESSITGDLTIQGLVKPDSVAINHCVVSKYNAGLAKRCYYLALSSDELRFTASDNGAAAPVRESTNANLAQGVWVHIAVTYDASDGSCIFYKNGVALTDDGTGLETAIVNNDVDFEVGSLNVGGAWWFDGYIAHVALFDDIRTPGEILASSNDPTEDLSGAGNIIGQWHFNDAGAATAIDNSQGDAGRDLKPFDGGDTTFALCGRSLHGVTQDHVDRDYHKLNQADEPGDPADDYAVFWLSSGVGYGDIGDFCCKITEGGGTTDFTIMDYSAL